MASVWVDVDLDDVSTSDLIDELENRYLGEREQQWLLQQWLLQMIKSSNARKAAFFLAIEQRFSLLELEERLSEAFQNFPTPKEQLSLF